MGKSSALCRKLLLAREISGCLIANFRMMPDALVKHLDVFKDDLPGLLACSKVVVMQAFRFERTKKLSGSM